MAGRHAKSIDVQVNGVIETAVQATVINELIKFVLYQRNQIPMYFDQFRDLLAREAQRAENSLGKPRGLANTRQKSSQGQQQQLVRTLEDLFKIVRDVFESIHLIKQVLIILGPNIILPRDAYLVHLPSDFYEGQVITAKSCIQSVFHTFYNEEFLTDAAPLNSCTNLFVLFLAPRSCHHSTLNLLPQLNYTLPSSASCLYEVKLSCRAELGTAELGSPLSRTPAGRHDISGVYPLDEEETQVTTSMDCTEVLSPKKGHASNDDYVWFQAPVTVKGYREKLSDTVGLWGH